MKSPLVAVCLYKDRSGLLTTETRSAGKGKTRSNMETRKPKVRELEN